MTANHFPALWLSVITGALSTGTISVAAAPTAQVIQLPVPDGANECVSASFQTNSSTTGGGTLKLGRRCPDVTAVVCTFSSGQPAPAWRCDEIQLSGATKGWISPAVALDGKYYVGACKAHDEESCFNALGRLEGAAHNRQDHSFDIVGVLTGTSGDVCHGKPIAQCGLVARGERG